MNSILESKSSEKALLLIVDDSSENLQVLNALLKDDYRLKLAKNGAKGLEIASLHPQPDLILLDIMMPEMDGFAFLEAFERLDRGQKNRIKVVMLSTSESFKDLNRANKNVLVRKFLNKPLTADMLKAIHV